MLGVSNPKILMKVKKFQFYILCLLFTIGLIAGCDTENLLGLDDEILEVTTLSADSQTLNIGDTTNVTATVNYSGNTNALGYTWRTTGGKIVGDGRNVIYAAPETAGTYTITLEVTDGTATARKDIRIEVIIGHAIVSRPNRYWQGNTFRQTLTYQLNVTALFREKPVLRYEILQEAARTGAFLTIAINGTPLIQDRSIGEVQPGAPVPIIGEVDVSSVLQTPGRYTVTLTLEVVNVIEKAWLLQRLMLIGAEGTLSEQR